MKLKKMVAATLAVVMVAMMAGCGSSSTGKSTPPADTADKMLAAIKPQGELMEVEDSVLDNFYTVDPEIISEHKIYISTSWVAEEIAVFSYKDGKEAEAKKMVEQRLQDLKDSFDGYLPEEFASMNDNAKILTGGGSICLLAGTAENVAAAAKVFAELNN